MEPVQVGLLLLRQLASELELVPLDLVLLLLESQPGFLQAGFEKRRGFLSGRLAAFNVSLDEEGTQPGSNRHGDFRVLVVEGEGERIVGFQVVLAHREAPSHLIHHFLLVIAASPEKSQLVDHSQEAGTTEDLLLENRQAFT